MKRTIMLLMILLVYIYANAQQWTIEYPHCDNEDIVFVTGDMSGVYNYSLGYRYDKTADVMYPHVLCVDQEGNYISNDLLHECESGSFSAAIGMGNDNIVAVSYCTDNKDSDLYEKLCVSVLNPKLDVLYENYVQVQEPYVSFGYTAHIVVNGDNEFVVFVNVARNVTDEIMQDCDFEFYRFDGECNFLSKSILKNTSYNSKVYDFIYVSNLQQYMLVGNAMNVSGVSSVFFVDKDFNFISCKPIDNHSSYPNYVNPYFISVGRWYDDNTILMSMQTGNTSSEADYCPLVMKMDMDMNIIDSIMFERYNITDYISQYNSIVYVNPNTIYVSSFEVKGMFGGYPNEAVLYLIDEDLNMLGKKTFTIGSFINILNIVPTIDGGCVVQAYYETDSDKVPILWKLNDSDFDNDVAVDDPQEDIVILTYPNPVSSVLNINVKDMNCDNMRVQIYDISGRRRMDEKVVVNDKILSLDLSLLESGVYYYLITDENTSIVRDTFIKY